MRHSPVKTYWPDPRREPEEELSILPALLLVGMAIVACAIGWFVL